MKPKCHITVITVILPLSTWVVKFEVRIDKCVGRFIQGLVSVKSVARTRSTIAMLGAFFFALTVAFGMVSVAAPTASAAVAPAAYEKCNAVRVVYTNSVYYRMPVNGTTTSCWLAFDRSYSNPAVQALQTHIKKCYIDTGWISWSGAFDADGYFGDDTVSALKKVQAYEGLGQDGEYGPTTRSSMYLRWTEFADVSNGHSGCSDRGSFS